MNTTMRAVTGFVFAGLLAPAACGQECVAFTPIASVDTPSQAHRVQADGNRVYLADFYLGGLMIFDQSTADGLELLGAANAGPYGFEVIGDLAYVANDPTGLRVYDLSSPAAPELLSVSGEVIGARSVTVVANTAYLASDYIYAFSTYDVSDPSSPLLLARVSIGTTARDVIVSEPYAYVAARYRGIRILDISDPAAPELVASGPGYHSEGIDLAGEVAYLADEDGLRLVDVSDPTDPQEIALYPLDYPALDVRLVGDVAFVAASEAGVYAINVASPSAPRVVGVYDTPGTATGIDVQGDRVYVADGEAGLLVLEMTACEPCPADLNFDRRLDFYDVQLFLNYFAAGDGRADFTGDGSFAWDDVQAMLDAYASGCP